jgi:hypothetical protein
MRVEERMKTALTGKQRAQMKLDAVRLFIKRVEQETRQDDDDVDRLLTVLRVFCRDVELYLEDEFPEFNHCLDLKEAISEAHQLMSDLSHNHREDMAGWHHGKEPSNPAQHLCNLLSDVHFEMARTTAMIEESMPELRLGFERIKDWQRQGLPIR